MRMQILRITGEFNFSDNRKGKKYLLSFPESLKRYSQNIQAGTYACRIEFDILKEFWSLYRISIPGYCWVPADPASLLLAFSSQFSTLSPEYDTVQIYFSSNMMPSTFQWTVFLQHWAIWCCRFTMYPLCSFSASPNGNAFVMYHTIVEVKNVCIQIYPNDPENV